jgi:hypothetical protein
MKLLSRVLRWLVAFFSFRKSVRVNEEPKVIIQTFGPGPYRCSNQEKSDVVAIRTPKKPVVVNVKGEDKWFDLSAVEATYGHSSYPSLKKLLLTENGNWIISDDSKYTLVTKGRAKEFLKNHHHVKALHEHFPDQLPFTSSNEL